MDFPKIITATVPSWDRENGTLGLQLAGQDARALRRPEKWSREKTRVKWKEDYLSVTLYMI